MWGIDLTQVNHIKSLRLRSGLKAKEFAKLICVTPEHLSRAEHNKLSMKKSTMFLAELVSAAAMGASNKQLYKMIFRGAAR